MYIVSTGGEGFSGEKLKEIGENEESSSSDDNEILPSKISICELQA